MSDKKHLYLVDASSLFFRAYYAIPFMETNLSSKKILPTNALYGYMTTSLKILDRFKPHHIIYCFDSPVSSVRVDYYKEYKANRGEMPEDLEEQVPYIKQVTELLGLPLIQKEKYEADDLIGSLVSWALKNKVESTVISTDKDFAQLVGDNVQLYDPVQEKFYDSKAVFDKWKVHPSQIVDYLALVGDASDNIPGVRGIGKKGAEKLLAKYKTLDSMYKFLKEMDPKMAAKLIESKKDAFVSQKLATIIKDLKLFSHLKEMQRDTIKKDELRFFLEQMKFKSLHKKLFSEPKNSKPLSSRSSKKNQKVVKVNLGEVSEVIKPYEEVGVFLSEDLEKPEICLYLKKGIFQIPQVNLEKLGMVLDRKRVKWWGYDLKTLWKKIKTRNPIPVFDLMVAGHLVKNQTSPSLSYLCESLLEREFSKEESFHLILELRKKLEETLVEMNLNSVFQDVEIPLIFVLHQMEQRGVFIDVQKLKKEKKDLECDLLKLEEGIVSLAGHPFNVASPQQLNHVLFEELKLKKGKKTKTGYSTDSSVLQTLKGEHPIAEILLEYRELFKLKTTYVEGLLQEVNLKTNRIHTSFKQTMTSTGRLSSVHPNLQNIPIRTSRGRKIREVFIAPPHKSLICADYSQIELRILAHFSQDKGFLKAFQRGEDIHKSTALELFGGSLEKITSGQRRIAKAVNFGIIYGQTSFGLSQMLEISKTEAEDILERYFKKFPSIKSYTKSVVRQAQKNGYVDTLLGRRRTIKEVHSRNKNVQKLGERLAINTRIQGTASEVVKKAMIELNDSIWSSLLIQVHDELLFECLNEDLDVEVKNIQNIMENIIELKVPLKVDISYAQNWNQAK